MSQMDLLRIIQKKHPNHPNLHRQHLSEAIIKNMTEEWAKLIEEGLELEKGTLCRWVKEKK